MALPLSKVVLSTQSGQKLGRADWAKENPTVRKTSSLLLALVFVLSLGSFAFAQNSNTGTTTTTTSTTGRMKHHRKHKKHHRRHRMHKSGGGSTANGNSNT
ncbi:MAG TPA: hypothetical protein VF525_05950 [Pyrinomonadaceae bacterium]|jgi:hypothetical protein